MNSEDRERKKQKADRDAFRMIAMVTQFGINMLVPIFLCFFVGYLLDKKLGTNYLIIVFFFLGAAAGFRNIYIFVKKQNERDKRENVPDDTTKLIEKALEDERKNHSK